MTTHARISGSKAGRIIGCPGSVRLSERAVAMFGENDSEYAAHGTAMHTAMELLLNAKVTAPDDLLGRVITDEKGNTHTITKDDIASCIQPALDAFDIDLRFVLDQLGGHEDFYYWPEVKVEFQRGKKDDVFNDAGGTTDVLGICESDVEPIGVVADWKFGVTPVSPNSAQLFFYAAASIEDKKFAKKFEGINKFVLAVIQPRRMDGGKVLEHIVVTRDELAAFKVKLREAVVRSQQDDAPFSYGSWCSFCPAQSICPKMTQLAREAPKQVPDEMTLEQLAEALKQARFVEGWCRSVFATAERLALEGQQVPGHKLVHGRASRDWARDEAGVVAELVKVGLNANECFESKLVSVAQAEKKLGKKFTELPETIVARTPGKLTLVTMDDKRDAVQVSSDPLEQAINRMGR